MGHTTRMIGLANVLREEGADVLFALPQNQQFLLDGTDFQSINLPGYTIKYYVGIPPTLSLLLQMPKILWMFVREPFFAKKLVKKHNIKLIISDNRPFFRCRGVHSVYVTHQCNLPIRQFWKPLIQRFYLRTINKFDSCLVPDFPDSSLSGNLSKNFRLKIPTHFCGPLSRFMGTNNNSATEEKKYTLVFIASGPQPYRNNILARVKKIFSQTPGRFAIIGDMENNPTPLAQNVDVFESLDITRFREILNVSSAILSLAGYTTIMDAVVVSKPLVMWPTPGQGEQEYLAKHLKGTRGIYVMEKPEEINKLIGKHLEAPYASNYQQYKKEITSIFKV
jgi:UDP:flavonoid glycosyltransferase YjiC (YdhE family)